MFIRGLEELSEKDLENINIDFLQDIIYIISQVEPINLLGSILHIGNVDTNSGLSFELDNGKKLMEVSVATTISPILVRINFDNRAIQYLCDMKNKKIVCKDSFLQNDKMILKYRYTNYKYYFELYIYEPIFDISFEFHDCNFNAELFAKKLFSENIDFDEILSIVPKEDLKIKIITEEDESELIFKDNKLISSNKKGYSK